MNFGMITLNQSINGVALNGVALKTEQNHVTWILTVLLFIFKTEDFYNEIANDAEKQFDTSNDRNDKRPLSIGKNKKVMGPFKDELGEKIMKELLALRAKTHSYLMDDDSEHKKAKGTKKCVIKRRLMFENYTDCLFNDKTRLKL